jgi:hypothetical protein
MKPQNNKEYITKTMRELIFFQSQAIMAVTVNYIIKFYATKSERKLPAF